MAIFNEFRMNTRYIYQYIIFIIVSIKNIYKHFNLPVIGKSDNAQVLYQITNTIMNSLKSL